MPTPPRASDEKEDIEHGSNIEQTQNSSQEEEEEKFEWAEVIRGMQHFLRIVPTSVVHERGHPQCSLRPQYERSTDSIHLPRFDRHPNMAHWIRLFWPTCQLVLVLVIPVSHL